MIYLTWVGCKDSFLYRCVDVYHGVKGDSPPIRKEADLCQMFLTVKSRANAGEWEQNMRSWAFYLMGSPLLYHGKKGQAGITTVLEKFAQLPGWKTIEEAGNLIALKGPRGRSHYLRTGGTVGIKRLGDAGCSPYLQ